MFLMVMGVAERSGVLISAFRPHPLAGVVVEVRRNDLPHAVSEAHRRLTLKGTQLIQEHSISPLFQLHSRPIT